MPHLVFGVRASRRSSPGGPQFQMMIPDRAVCGGQWPLWCHLVPQEDPVRVTWTEEGTSATKGKGSYFRNQWLRDLFPSSVASVTPSAASVSGRDRMWTAGRRCASVSARPLPGSVPVRDSPHAARAIRWSRRSSDDRESPSVGRIGRKSTSNHKSASTTHVTRPVIPKSLSLTSTRSSTRNWGNALKTVQRRQGGESGGDWR